VITVLSFQILVPNFLFQFCKQILQ